MSTEVPASGSRGFRRRLLVTLLVLALLTGSFAVLNMLQGAKLTNAAIDARLATDRAGTTLVLTANQPIDSIADVTVSPDEAVDVAIDGRTVSLAFERPLADATDYDVTLSGVVGTIQPTHSEWTYSFSTPDRPIGVLARSAEGDDRVLVRDLHGGAAGSVLFSAPVIRSFDMTSDGLVAALTVEPDGSTRAWVGGPDGAAELVPPPEAAVGATMSELHASPTNPLVGYTVSTPGTPEAPGLTDALVLHDLSGTADGAARFVGVFGDTPASVLHWTFVPGTSSVVVQDAEFSLFLVDALGLRPPQPLGRFDEMRGFVPGTTTLIVADPDAGSLIDLATGSVTRLELPLSELADGTYAGRTHLLSPDGAYIQSFSVADYSTGSTRLFSSVARVDADGTTTELFAPASTSSRVDQYCPAPNGRSVAVVTVPLGAVPDSDGVAPGFADSLTTIVDAVTGAVIASSPGAFPDWCR